MSPRAYEEEPQVGDYRRSSYDSSSEDRELTLSTPAILGLFFALVVVCGCFFGLGYAMGHRTTPTPQVFDNATAPSTSASKPTAGSAATPDATPAADSSAAAASDASTPSSTTATVPLNSPATAAPATAASATPAASTRAVATAPRPTAPAGAAAPPSQPAAAPAPGTFVVQVAAVSSQDVANILLSTLQKKGYAVAARHEPQDQLLHIQIGPFPDRKDAEAMRQRVLADGFNAIVK